MVGLLRVIFRWVQALLRCAEAEPRGSARETIASEGTLASVSDSGIPQRVVIVTRQLPGHQIGLQYSGHAAMLGAFLGFFHSRGARVLLVVLDMKIDFLIAPARRFPYEIVGTGLRRVGPFYVVTSFKVAASAIAWTLYARQPRRIQQTIDSFRMSIRKRSGFTHVMGRFPSQYEIAFARMHIERERPGLILYESIFSYCGKQPNVQEWITGDVMHARAASFMGQGIVVHPQDLTVETERAILESAGNVVAIQWDEAAEFRRFAPRCRVVVLPVPFEVSLVSSMERVDGRCIFVASGSMHNLDGIRWFIDSCWEQIRQAVPSAHLEIYGSIGMRLSNVPNGVILKGVVDDISQAYAAASVVLVPLRVGSGLKVKTVEAISYGVPTVTTSIGAQGLMHMAPQPFLIANDAQTFTAAVVRLLQSRDLQTELRQAAADCSRVFRPEQAFAEFETALREYSSKEPLKNSPREC